jgi:hypothetical protein
LDVESTIEDDGDREKVGQSSSERRRSICGECGCLGGLAASDNFPKDLESPEEVRRGRITNGVLFSLSSSFRPSWLCAGGLGIAFSASLGMEKGETACGCSVDLTTCAERPGASGVSIAEISTSKLISLRKDSKESAELTNEICEQTEGGRDKIGVL